MTGYVYGEDQPTEDCPYCRTKCVADFVDIGVGYTQCGPFHCESCGASEIGPFDAERALTDDERKIGWYRPGSDPGSSANVIGGNVVSHAEMRDAYASEFTGNPAWEDKEQVEKWWRDIRAIGKQH